MGRLINTNDIRVKPQYMQDVMGIAMIRCEDLSRILADAPTVEAIPKAQYDELKANITMMRLDYEARLKADLVAMLTEIQLEVEEVKTQSGFDEAWDGAVKQCSEIIQQKIDKLKEAD